jgi:cob(I)alamin adenosyltransferase
MQDSGRKKMKIYTGTGDKGKTSLFSGERVLKSDARIDAYGDLDELNSVLGALVAHLVDEKERVAELQQIQSDLFQAGAWLATRPDSAAIESLEEISTGQIVFLEKAIDRLEKELRTYYLGLGPCGSNRLSPLRTQSGATHQ